MRTLARSLGLLILLALAASGANPQSSSGSHSDRDSILIVLKDGHQQSIPVADVTRIEFKADAMIISRDGRQQTYPLAEIARMEFETPGSAIAGRARFVGKWRMGDGAGGHFYATLDRDGSALKSIGPSHGSWTVVGGEARINWDDGWHDAIRKVGNKYEKAAFAPGQSFSDDPSNVAAASKADSEPI